MMHPRATGLACLGAFIAMMVVVVPTRAQTFTPPTYVGTIGQPGHAGVYAWGMATAQDGSLLVGDYWNYQIRRFDTEGNLLQTIGSRGGGLGQNQAPYGIAVDPNDGSFYVADYNSDWEIDKFSATGQPLGSFSTYVLGLTVPYPYITRLAVNSRGWVYAVSSHNVPSFDQYKQRILVFNSSGRFQFAFGANGFGDGQFRLNHGIDIGPSDQVYVADAGNPKVQVFSSAGSYIRKFGSKGTNPGQFSGDIRGLVVDDNDGWVYVVDAGASQIEKFDLQGNHLATFGSQGSGPGQFLDGGREITVGPDNNVYVADFGNNRVNVYSPDGTFLRYFPNPPLPPPDGGFNQADDVAVNSSTGDVYVVDTYNHRIQQFEPLPPDGLTDTFVSALDPTTGYKQHAVSAVTNGLLTANLTWDDPAIDIDLILKDPSGVVVKRSTTRAVNSETLTYDLPVPGTWRITVKSKGGGTNYKLIVSHSPNVGSLPNRPRRFAFVRTWGHRGTDDHDAMNYPRGIAVDGASGDVWLNNTREGNIKVYDSQGDFVKQFWSWGDQDNQVYYSRGIAVGTDDRIYVADASNRRIKVADKSGQTLFMLPCGTPATGGLFLLQGCTDVSVDSAGNIYAAAPTENAVYRWNSSGALIDKWGSSGSGPGQLAGPYGIAVYGDRVYVSEQGNGRISVFDLDGDFIGTFGKKGTGHGGFKRPHGLAVDAEGLLYVADQGNERIEVYKIN